MPLTWLGSCMVPRAAKPHGWAIVPIGSHWVKLSRIICYSYDIPLLKFKIQKQTLLSPLCHVGLPEGTLPKPAGFRGRKQLKIKTKWNHVEPPNPQLQTEYLHCLTIIIATCIIEVCILYFWIQSHVSTSQHYWNSRFNFWCHVWMCALKKRLTNYHKWRLVATKATV